MIFMEKQMERLTTSEAAVAAGVTIPQIHRVIDEKILPEDLYSANLTRTFRAEATVLIAFYFETAGYLTAQARIRTIENARKRCANWEDWANCTVEDQPVTVAFSSIWKAVNGRLDKLRKAREMVVEDPEILSGTPVIHGTRVPVYQIAAEIDAGTPVEQILYSYPSVKEWQVELASIYAKAVPARGRPPRSWVIPPGTKVTVTRVPMTPPLFGGSTPNGEISDR